MAGAHLLEQDLLLHVGVGVTDRGDVLAWDTVLHQLGDDVGIDRVAPGGRVDPQIGEDQLGAACRGRALPDGRDVRDEGVGFGVGEILGRGGEQPRIERQFAAVCRDGQGVILPGLDLPGPDRLIARHKRVLDSTLRLGPWGRR